MTLTSNQLKTVIIELGALKAYPRHQDHEASTSWSRDIDCASLGGTPSLKIPQNTNF